MNFLCRRWSIRNFSSPSPTLCVSHSVASEFFTTRGLLPNQVPMGFSRWEYWSGLPVPCPGDLPDPEVKHGSHTLQAGYLPCEPRGKPPFSHYCPKLHFHSYPVQSGERKQQTRVAVAGPHSSCPKNRGAGAPPLPPP